MPSCCNWKRKDSGDEMCGVGVIEKEEEEEKSH